jgi:hypothetical protein
MFALFSADDLLAQQRGQLALDELFVEPEMPAVTVVEPVAMPAPLALIQREDITGQGVLGA